MFFAWEGPKVDNAPFWGFVRAQLWGLPMQKIRPIKSICPFHPTGHKTRRPQFAGYHCGLCILPPLYLLTHGEAAGLPLRDLQSSLPGNNLIRLVVWVYQTRALEGGAGGPREPVWGSGSTMGGSRRVQKEWYEFQISDEPSETQFDLKIRCVIN